MMHVLKHGAIMEVTGVDLRPLEEQLLIDGPAERVVEVEIRGGPADESTPATRVTFLRRLELFCRAHSARPVRFESGTAGVRLVFTLAGHHLPKLFEVVKL